MATTSRIEQIIDEIEEYISNCKFQPLSTTKIVVNREEIEDLLRELRLKTPEEVKRYQKIIANKDAIIVDAQTKADTMLTQAKETIDQMLSEHEIIKRAIDQANEIVADAQRQANDILDRATNDANEIRTGSIQYTDEMLETLQTVIGNTIDSAGAKYGALLKTLQECFDVLSNNRSELNSNNYSYEVEESYDNYDYPAASEEVYDNIPIEDEEQYDIDPDLDSFE